MIEPEETMGVSNLRFEMILDFQLECDNKCNILSKNNYP